MSPGCLILATWNLQGSHGVDAAEVSRRLRAASPTGHLDVVALQEVHRRQARAIAEALGMSSTTWAFKHWPIVRGREGQAVLGRAALTRIRAVLVHRAPFWSWRRRIAVLATADTALGPVHVANVHLSPHDQGELRDAQVDTLVAALGRFGAATEAFVIGDFNDHPGAFAHAKLLGLGWRDAWILAHGDAAEPAGATNWTAGPRTGRPPTQRLDYVLVPPGWDVERIEVGATTEHGSSDDWAALSDHLPVVAVLRRTG